jgi:hypothetical protein
MWRPRPVVHLSPVRAGEGVRGVPRWMKRHTAPAIPWPALLDVRPKGGVLPCHDARSRAERNTPSARSTSASPQCSRPALSDSHTSRTATPANCVGYRARTSWLTATPTVAAAAAVLGPRTGRPENGCPRRLGGGRWITWWRPVKARGEAEKCGYGKLRQSKSLRSGSISPVHI